MNTNIALKRMREVIKTDSVTSSEADFLATHVAFENIKVINRGQDERADNTKVESEENLFNTFVTNEENRHQFIVVRGDSGAGKSHLIRWFATRLKQARLEDEEVLFIRRSDNNLKRTIEQLLNLEAVRNIKNKNIIERLTKASVMIDDSKFKDMIYQTFIVEIKNHDDTDILSRIRQKELEALLQNERIHRALKEVGGPIDRIYAKVSNKEGMGSKDLIALFKPEDFMLDIEVCEELRRDGADRKAQKAADKLASESEFASDVARFLNQFVDTVIQHCSGIESGDIREVFREIRQELKANGKNLTLLIEDITACTGINTELLDVLTTEHTGEYEDQKLCRLSSFIGSTNEYYKEFRDNFRDRITNQFVIEANQFGTNDTSIYEFVGRYLNVMSLQREQIETWVEDGCKAEYYPIHECDEGVKWDKVSLKGDKELVLYPFTKHAILNLYHNLDKKTPRYMLSEIIEKVVNDALYNKENFPQFDIRNMPNWNPTTHGQVLSNEIKDSTMIERMNKFIRIWGEAHVKSQVINSITYIGGLPDFMYEEFGLPIIKGVASQQAPSQVIPLTVEKKPQQKVVTPIIEQKVQVVPKVEQVPTLSPKQQKYQNELKLVEAWAQGAMLENFEGIRDHICNYLLTAINWQEEGISYDTIIKINNSKKQLIEFERQKRGQGLGFIVLPCNSETQNIVEAFLAWEILGDKKWQFEGAVYMQYQVALWTEKIRKELVKSILEIDGQEISYFEYACIGEIYRLIVTGNYKGTTLNSITEETLLSNNMNVNLSETGHSKQWQSLITFMKSGDQDKQIKDTVIQYFNLPQGKIGKSYTDQIFINSTKFKLALSNVLKHELEVDEEALNYTDTLAPRNNIKDYLKNVLQRIEPVVQAEKSLAEQYNSVLSEYLGEEEFIDEDIKEICEEIKKYYEEVIKYQFNVRVNTAEISQIKQAAHEITNAINTMKKGLECNEDLKFLLLFSQDPLSKVSKFNDLLKKVRDEALKIQEEARKKQERLSVDSLSARTTANQNQLEQQLEKYNKWIQEMGV